MVCHSWGAFHGATGGVQLVVRAVTIVTALAFASQGFAEVRGSLAEVQQLSNQADFDAGERMARELLASGTLNRAEVAGLHLELGVVAAARNDTSGAELAFRRALRLAPALKLRETAGPHVLAPFTHAKQSVSASEPLGVSIELSRPVGRSDIEVLVRVNGDSDGLVRRVVLDDGSVLERLELEASQTSFVQRAVVKADPCRRVIASVADEYGNRVWPELARLDACPALAVETNASVTKPLADAPRAAQIERPVPSYVWIGVAATSGLVVATTAFGFLALERRDDYHHALDDAAASHQEKDELRERASNAQLTATILGVASLAAAGTTVLLYLTRPRSTVHVAFELRPASRATQATLTGRF